MLFPRIPVEELKAGDRFLDTDGLEWTIARTDVVYGRESLVQAERQDEGSAVIHTDFLELGEPVAVDQMWRQFTAGRCGPCRVLYVWARRWRVLLRDARCPECGDPLRGTNPRQVKPGRLVDRAEFRCPLGG